MSEVNKSSEADGNHDSLVLEDEDNYQVIFHRSTTPAGVSGALIRCSSTENNQKSTPEDNETRIGISTRGLRRLTNYLLQSLLAENRPEDEIEIISIKPSNDIVTLRPLDGVAKTVVGCKGSRRTSMAHRLLNNFGIEDIRLYIGEQEYRKKCEVVKEMSQGLDQKDTDEAYWQKFFVDNRWILEQHAFMGPVIYLNGESLLGGKSTEGRSGSGGVSTDHLFMDQSSKSFAVVEIKTPAARLVGATYRGRDTSSQIFSPHTELSGALVQAQKQLKTAIENFASYLGKDYQDEGLNCLHPQSVLITGNLGNLSDLEIASFNLFRRSIYPTTIITYDEILARIRSIYHLGEEDA